MNQMSYSRAEAALRGANPGQRERYGWSAIVDDMHRRWRWHVPMPHISACRCHQCTWKNLAVTKNRDQALANMLTRAVWKEGTE